MVAQPSKSPSVPILPTPSEVRAKLFSRYSDEQLSKLFALIPLVERDLLNLRIHEKRHYAAIENATGRYPSTQVHLDEFDAYGPDLYDDDVEDEDEFEEYGDDSDDDDVDEEDEEDYRSDFGVQGSFGEQPGMDTFPELKSDPLARIRAIADAQGKTPGGATNRNQSNTKGEKVEVAPESTKRELLLRSLSSLQNATGISHCLDRDSSRLLLLAAWHGGELTLGTLLQELRSSKAIPVDVMPARQVPELKRKPSPKGPVQHTASSDDPAIDWIAERFESAIEKLEFVGLAVPGSALILAARVAEKVRVDTKKAVGKTPRSADASIDLDCTLITLFPDVARTVRLPGQSISYLLSSTPNETVTKWLSANGVKPIGTTRFELSHALLSLFGSRTAMAEVISGLSIRSVGHLQVMLSTLEQVLTDRLGVSYYRPGSGSVGAQPQQYRAGRYGDSLRGYGSGPRFGMSPAPSTPAEKAEEQANALALDELYNRGLIGYDATTQSVWVWREVAVSVRAYLIVDWSITARPQLGALESDGRNQAFSAAESMNTIHRYWFKNPPAALTDGSIGVATIRAASKAIKLDAPTVTLATALLVDDSRMKLVITGTSGRGRNKIAVYGWQVDDPGVSRKSTVLVSGGPGKRADQAMAPSAAAGLAEELGGAEYLWRRRVFQWLHNDVTDETETFSPRISRGRKQSGTLRRTMILRILETLDPGTGAVNEAVLHRWIFEQHFEILSVDIVESVITACKSLGLIPRHGPVGLTNAARELLHDGKSILSSDETVGPQLIIGGDQTIVAPPETPHQVLELLGRYCDLSSDAGARMYRLSETKLGAAFGAGLHANDVIEVLQTNAKTPVPQSVEFLIHDVQRRHGQILVSSAVTVITCVDAALLVQAVNVKAAALSLLSSTVAVSLLPAAKVFNALEVKGLLPAMFSGTATGSSPGHFLGGEQTHNVSSPGVRQQPVSGPSSEIDYQPMKYRSFRTIEADLAMK
jgi:hypothetical protein